MIFQYVKPGRIRLSADRGFPDDDLFSLLDELGIDHIIHVKGSVKVFYRERRGKFTRSGSKAMRYDAALGGFTIARDRRAGFGSR